MMITINPMKLAHRIGGMQYQILNILCEMDHISQGMPIECASLKEKLNDLERRLDVFHGDLSISQFISEVEGDEDD